MSKIRVLCGLPINHINRGETEAVRSRPRQRQFFWGRDKPMKYRGSWHEAEASKFSASRQPQGEASTLRTTSLPIAVATLYIQSKTNACILHSTYTIRLMDDHAAFSRALKTRAYLFSTAFSSHWHFLMQSQSAIMRDWALELLSYCIALHCICIFF